MAITTLPLAQANQALSGLSSEEASRRLAHYGPNDPAPSARRSTIFSLLLLFLNPLAVVLLIAAVFSAFLGQIADATIIVTMVLLGILVNFIQTYRSQRAVETLRQLVRTTASVLRDGVWQEMPRHDVVPGDIVRLAAGDLVPADAMLLESKDLYVHQASLTGESLPAEKEVAPGEAPVDKPDASYMVFLGTSVVSGSAVATVTATGPRTLFGGIAARLRDHHQETEFERGLRHFGLLIMRVVFFLVLFLITVSIALHRDAFQSVLFAVALAVGLTPEFLPMITSVTLAKGALQMARRNVIVKHLPAIQNLGSIDVLCSDKTGTLTRGTMKLEHTLDAVGSESDRVLPLAHLNSQFETGIRNPLNTAILEQQCPGTEGYIKCDEIPFDFERRCVSIVVERHGERLFITKGAPEGVLARCSKFQSIDGVSELSNDVKNASLQTFHELSAKGYRVLAVAYREIDERDGYSREDEVGLVLYDLSQVTIPTETVDDAYLRRPQRWNMTLIRNFMLLIGPISSVYEFLTFFVLLRVFHASQPEFHTGWFVESLATQTLVLVVIRTFGNPLKSRPSVPLIATVLTVVLVGLFLPFSPAAPTIGFTPLPIRFFLFLLGVTCTYLFLVEIAKRRLFSKIVVSPAHAQGSAD